MKKILLLLFCLASAYSANAQFVQDYNESKTGINKFYTITSDPSYKYSTQTEHGFEHDSDDGSLFGVVYTRSQSIANSSMYLEFGGGFLYTRFNDIMYSDDADLKLYSFYLPVNLSFRFNEAENLSGSFFAGPYMKYNFAGSYAGIDIFTTEVGTKAQFGWQAGVDVGFNGWYLNFSYFSDISDLIDYSSTGYNVKNRVSGVLIGLGALF